LGRPAPRQPWKKTTQIYAAPLECLWGHRISFGRIRNGSPRGAVFRQVTPADRRNERLVEQASLAEVFFEIRGQERSYQFTSKPWPPIKSRWIFTQAQTTGVGDKISVVEAQSTSSASSAANDELGHNNARSTSTQCRTNWLKPGFRVLPSHPSDHHRSPTGSHRHAVSAAAAPSDVAAAERNHGCGQC